MRISFLVLVLVGATLGACQPPPANQANSPTLEANEVFTKAAPLEEMMETDTTEDAEEYGAGSWSRPPFDYPAGEPPSLPKLAAGTDFGVAREWLLANGFKPEPMPRKDDGRCSAGALACEAYPETLSCLGTGSAGCTFVYRGENEWVLIVETVGEVESDPATDMGVHSVRWGDPGDWHMIKDMGGLLD